MTTKAAAKQSPRGATAKRAPTRSVALYARVARELKAEIADGTFPVGTILPTEAELCGRFKVSRHTVREALRCLREEDLVRSRQGSGTMVIPPRGRDVLSLSVSSVDDLTNFAPGLRLRVISSQLRTVGPEQAARIGVEPGSTWLVVTGLGEARGTDNPLCWCEHYIPRKFAAVGRLLPRYTGAVFALIEDMFDEEVNEVELDISAGPMPAELAGLLKVEDASAAVFMRRAFNTVRGGVAQITVHVHPANRLHYRTKMTRKRPGL